MCVCMRLPVLGWCLRGIIYNIYVRIYTHTQQCSHCCFVPPAYIATSATSAVDTASTGRRHLAARRRRRRAYYKCVLRAQKRAVHRCIIIIMYVCRRRSALEFYKLQPPPPPPRGRDRASVSAVMSAEALFTPAGQPRFIYRARMCVCVCVRASHPASVCVQ